jgi:hypothetical protein
MDGDLDQVEPDQILPGQGDGIDAGDGGQSAGQGAEGGRGDDPAPAGRAVGQVDADVPQQAGQSSDDGAKDHRPKGQKAVLQTQIHRGNRAGDHGKAAQQEEQKGAQNDGAGLMGQQAFHGRPPCVFYHHSGFSRKSQ